MLDELRQIAIFAKTVDHGSFRGAAQDLRLSPSVVSHHIGKLEERLGTALLYRSTRKLSLTPEGERLLVAARNMVDSAESGIQAVTKHTQQLSGTLRLTAPALLAQSNFTHRVAKFALKFPKVHVALDFSDGRRDIIADGYDAAIRVGQMKDSSLKAKKLLAIERRLVASPDFLVSLPEPNSPEELSEWDWLELAPVWHQKPEFVKAGKRLTITRKKPRISANNAHALCRLARAGAGLAIVPAFLTEDDIEAGKLVHVLKDWTLDSVEAFAVWPSNAPKDGLIKQFIDFLKLSS